MRAPRGGGRHPGGPDLSLLRGIGGAGGVERRVQVRGGAAVAHESRGAAAAVRQRLREGAAAGPAVVVLVPRSPQAFGEE